MHLIFFLRLTFEDVLHKNEEEGEGEVSTKGKKSIIVEPHVPPSRGPYVFNEPKKYVVI